MKEYWFTGFFFRMTDQDKLPEFVLSIKEQWPRVVCRLVKEPFIGLGVRMTNSVWDVHDEKAGEQFFLTYADQDVTQVPGWITPLTFLSIIVGFCCLYGLIIEDGIRLWSRRHRFDFWWKS